MFKERDFTIRNFKIRIINNLSKKNVWFWSEQSRPASSCVCHRYNLFRERIETLLYLLGKLTNPTFN